MGQEVTETKEEKKNKLVLNLSTEPLITFNEKNLRTKYRRNIMRDEKEEKIEIFRLTG